MKIALTIMVLFCFVKVYSQDTIYQRAKPPFAATVMELDENFVKLKRLSNGIEGNPELIKVAELKKIKFKGGYIERFKTDTFNRIDKITFVNNASINCNVEEVNQYYVIAESLQGDSLIILPVDSLSSITFSNGYVENFHPQRKPVIEKKLEELPKQEIVKTENAPVIDKSKTREQSGSGRKQSTSSVQEAETLKVRDTETAVAVNKETSPVIKAVAVEKKEPEKKAKKPSGSKTKPVDYNLNSIAGHPFLGIGLIVDSATGLSRSFAFYELFKNNLLASETDTLYPVMLDYQFNAPYAITGTSGPTLFRLKLYKNGKKLKEVTAKNDWADIYNKVVAAFSSIKIGRLSNKFRSVSEGSIENIDAKRIQNSFPGTIETHVPYHKIIEPFRQSANISFYYSKSAYQNMRDLYGKFSQFIENKLFFFRNDNIPANLKEVTKPLVFPLYKSLSPSLTYLSSGKQLQEEDDHGAALSAFYAALYTSNEILASPYERALIRKEVFELISSSHRSLSSNRTYTSTLFKLGQQLNQAYINSPEAKNDRDTYYASIEKVKDLCVKAEDKAREIRSQNRMGLFMTALSVAGSVATADAVDNSVSEAFMDQATTYLTTTFAESDKLSTALTEQYKGVENMISSEEFITTDGTSIELGKPYLAGEVYYHLKHNPAAVQPILVEYAKDKPKLNRLIGSFYANQQDDAVLNSIFLHLSEMEAKIVNNEVRNLPLNEKTTSTF